MSGRGVLPDARILVEDAERLLLPTGATTRYGHGVLGDQAEAGQITLVETAPTSHVALTISLRHQNVVEGIAPIWADLDDEGAREIIVAVSDEHRGAQIVVFDESGDPITGLY